LLDLLYNRRSIRKYKSAEIEQDKIEKLIQSALLAPSSRNRKPVEIIVVVMADSAVSDMCTQDSSIVATILQLTAESLGLGSCWVQLRGRKTSAGVPSEEYLADLLNIPSNFSVEAIIAIGYKDETPTSYTKDSLDYKKVHFNKYSV